MCYDVRLNITLIYKLKDVISGDKFDAKYIKVSLLFFRLNCFKTMYEI